MHRALRIIPRSPTRNQTICCCTVSMCSVFLLPERSTRITQASKVNCAACNHLAFLQSRSRISSWDTQHPLMFFFPSTTPTYVCKGRILQQYLGACKIYSVCRDKAMCMTGAPATSWISWAIIGFWDYCVSLNTYGSPQMVAYLKCKKKNNGTLSFSFGDSTIFNIFPSSCSPEMTVYSRSTHEMNLHNCIEVWLEIQPTKNKLHIILTS